MTVRTPITGDASSKSYYVIHPVYATAQRGGNLRDSAASIIRYLVYKHGLPAVQHMLHHMADYNKLHEYPGFAGREFKLMDEMARQYGMGLS